MDKVLPDIPRLYTAIAEWMSCVVWILPLKKRFPIWKTTVIMAVMFAVQSIFMVVTGEVLIYLWLPCMATAVILMITFICLCCKISVTDAICYGMTAFVIAEFMASLEWQISCFFWPENDQAWWIKGSMLAGCYTVIAVGMFFMLRLQLSGEGQMNFNRKECLSAAVITMAVFAVSNLSYLSIRTPFSGQYSFEIGKIRTLVDLGGIAILYAHLQQCRELRVRQELEAVQSVLKNQYLQYQQSKESIELINYKYHDLKHQIAFLRSEEDPQKREVFLKRMEDEIAQYEAQNKTGNKVLDTVLTTKSLYCAKNGIMFTCVADGTLLDFMDVMDICSIFGNALDNAIECEMKIPDREKRLIHVTVSRQKNFLILRFENYYEGVLQYREGSLVTTKKEKQQHGYGLKSIRYTVDKYDGAVNIEAKDNWFLLRILIPIRQ